MNKAKRGRPPKYDFGKLRIGESMLIAGVGVNSSAYVAAQQYGKRHDKTFSGRTIRDGLSRDGLLITREPFLGNGDISLSTIRDMAVGDKLILPDTPEYAGLRAAICGGSEKRRRVYETVQLASGLEVTRMPDKENAHYVQIRDVAVGMSCVFPADPKTVGTVRKYAEAHGVLERKTFLFRIVGDKFYVVRKD